MNDAFSNPFELINRRLTSIEALLIDLKHLPIKPTEEHEMPIETSEAAEVLNWTVPTLYKNYRLGRVKGYKRGNKLYFFKSELIDFIKQGKKETPYERDKRLRVEADQATIVANKGKLKRK